MAHLWFRDEDDVWSAMSLDERAVDISVRPPRFLAGELHASADAPVAVIRAQAGAASVWVLLVAEDGGVRVNGHPAVAGLRVLQDRDEIRAWPNEALYFSTETLAHAEEFTAARNIIYCGRCRQPLQNGQMAVRCPHCSIWYHENEKLPCWTYSSTCGFCPQGTALAAGYSWVPEA